MNKNNNSTGSNKELDIDHISDFMAENMDNDEQFENWLSQSLKEMNTDVLDNLDTQKAIRSIREKREIAGQTEAGFWSQIQNFFHSDSNLNSFVFKGAFAALGLMICGALYLKLINNKNEVTPVQYSGLEKQEVKPVLFEDENAKNEDSEFIIATMDMDEELNPFDQEDIEIEDFDVGENAIATVFRGEENEVFLWFDEAI